MPVTPAPLGKWSPLREAYYTQYTQGMSNHPGRRPAADPPSLSGEWGIIVPAVLIVGAVALLGFWPVMVWHGYTDTGGWRWDIHSTVAELTYWGVIGFIALLYRADHKPDRTAAPPKPKRERAWPPPKYVPPAPRLPDGFDPPSAALAPPAPRCHHLDAVPVDLSTGERVAWWCEACETQLDAGFGRLARPCCGSAPGTLHQYNCPHLKGSPS